MAEFSSLAVESASGKAGKGSFTCHRPILGGIVVPWRGLVAEDLKYSSSSRVAASSSCTADRRAPSGRETAAIVSLNDRECRLALTSSGSDGPLTVRPLSSGEVSDSRVSGVFRTRRS
jgi:hypothetical protein